MKQLSVVLFSIFFFCVNLNASEIENIINHFKKIENISFSFKQNINDKDDLYQSALEIVRSEGKASTSFLQRKLQIGYNRAARIVDQMEANGEVSQANHVGKREVLK